MNKFSNLSAGIAVFPLISLMSVQPASAVLLKYNFSGLNTNGFSFGNFPSTSDLDFDLTAIVDTETGTVNEFELTIDTLGTWSGIGGSASFFNDFDLLEIFFGTINGAIYDTIAQGLTPSTADFFLEGGDGTPPLFDDFVDGFPTTVNLESGNFRTNEITLNDADSNGARLTPTGSGSGTVVEPTQVPESEVVPGLVGAGMLALMSHRRRRLKAQRDA